MTRPRTITVCESCLTAACAQGHVTCWNHETALTQEMSYTELRRMRREMPCFWTVAANRAAQARRQCSGCAAVETPPFNGIVRACDRGFPDEAMAALARRCTHKACPARRKAP